MLTHSNLSDQSSNIDEEVKPTVDSLNSDSWINNNTLTRLESLDVHVLLTKLFHNQGVNIWLETTSTETDHNNSNDHGTKSTAIVLDNRRNRRDDENDVSDNVDAQGVADGLVTAPVLVGNVGTEKGHEVLPELVEGGDSGRGSLAHAEGTGLLRVGTGRGALRERLLDKVCDLEMSVLSQYINNTKNQQRI
jgi:hypothetical protein